MRNEYLKPENRELQRALLMLGNGNPGDAKIIIDEFLAAHPESPPAHRAKAMLLTHSEDFDGARESLLNAIRLAGRPNHSYSYELGEILIHLGRTVEAVDALSEAISLMKGAGEFWEMSSAFFLRAFSNFKLGNYAEALDDLVGVEEGIFFYDGELWNKVRLAKEISAASKSARR